MQAIILAAGMGRRLKELTQDNTKCMVRVNGVTLIERMLSQIDKKHFSRVVIVVGYHGQKLIDYIDTLNTQTPITYIDNPIYDKTNNIYSLALAKDWLLKDDTILFESDIIFEDSVLDSLLEDPRETLALVDKYQSWMDGTCIKLDEDDNIVDFISGRNFDFNNTIGCYKTVNIYKFSRRFSENYYIPFLDAYQKALGENEYYEQVLKVITMLDSSEIKGKRLNNQKWYEIDDAQDLDIAEVLFCDNICAKVEKIEERYGGYWRFPGLLDFCYLVNPYYPNQKIKDEMKASFDCLLTNYPSGMKVNSLLASKNFNVHQENIVVGNGAAELIKILMEQMEGKVGFIRPTFEEYPNRYPSKQSVVMQVDNPDYSYGIKEIESFFADKKIHNLIIINPDNPSGNYIEKEDLLSLIEWCDERKINIVIDESFADFADEKENSLLDQDILEKYKMLYVVKSISKSYGVPGLRLGIMASGDKDLIGLIKKSVSIWNINSFAEFYMQIAEKYKGQYENALIEFRNERLRFFKELKKISSIRIVPSQANYFMIELLNGHKVVDVIQQLYINHNILVKNLSKKLNGKEYIRVAIRDEDDNNKLVEALKSVLS
ncbi:Histidinol-phosphate/aromatic aminotransferase or cobyric acid decarboxylase [Pseudobutyrivibrio sp. NOR37]|uniref:Aminotransferase n=1 Tax=Pseudobutyrivibrio xylanivorans TaxID=185007 RepID=A0A6M0LI88_PSEXY|nr:MULTISPECIES: aminotransferase class I/II-fold pyridoxal phosphate-dependent enzyme [Pseudobutyrivibrio]NEX01870.1 aminotransferase class I/II-fold pyridoxal phosphate-dependent enzyme [Pseudobutyrivibrio xylanivorans]SFR72403.1 Histidinol-phosphate/aromatic aminotransferase or cobyric acid decarboxylase [Pseudobutyrivibrio sp. NOR37]